MILSICKEHGKECVLEFHTMAQAESIVKGLIRERVHFAAEVLFCSFVPAHCCSDIEFIYKAIAITACLLMDNVKAYNACPFIISHKNLLENTSHSLQDSQLPWKCHLYCIASDGDFCCCHSMSLLTLIHSLSTTSSIYPLLFELQIFNLLCGNNDITVDLDWKHILKHFHNTLLQMKGIVIDNSNYSYHHEDSPESHWNVGDHCKCYPCTQQ